MSMYRKVVAEMNRQRKKKGRSDEGKKAFLAGMDAVLNHLEPDPARHHLIRDVHLKEAFDRFWESASRIIST